MECTITPEYIYCQHDPKLERMEGDIAIKCRPEKSRRDCYPTNWNNAPPQFVYYEEVLIIATVRLTI